MDEGFVRNRRGAMVEKVAIAAGLVSLASLFLGSAVEQLASNGSLPTFAFLAPNQYVATKGKGPNFDSVDYTATGSITVLDPCTGQRKAP